MKFVKLGDVCKVRNGYAFKSENFSQDGIPLIRISDIQDNYVNPQKSARTMYEDVFENYKIIKGDILIAMSGATTGKLGVYNSDEAAYQNQRVGCFKIFDSNIINQTYLLQTLKVVKPIIEKKANGGAQPNISSSAIEEIQIPLPPLSDQIRIGEILSQAEALIAQRKVSIDLLDEYLKSTFLEIFGDPVRNAKEWLLIEIKDIIKEIQGGWSPLSLNKPRNNNSEWAVLKLSAVTNRRFISTENKVLDQNIKIKKEIVPQKGDLLFSRKNTYEFVGATAFIFESQEKLLLPDTIFKINYIPDIVSGIYLCYLFNDKNYRKEIQSLASGSSGSMPNISMDRLNRLKIPLPNIDIQTQFATIVESTEALKIHYQQSLLELQNMYAALSQKAFKGGLFESGSIQETIDKQTNQVFINSVMNSSLMEIVKETEKFKNINLLHKSTNSLTQIFEIGQQYKKMIEPFLNLPQLPKEIIEAQRVYNTFNVNFREKEKVITKLNFETIANIIIETYTGDYHFTFEMLIHLLNKKKQYVYDYFATEDLKNEPSLNESEDLKAFIYYALNDDFHFIKLEQKFYDAKMENFKLKLIKTDAALVSKKNKEEISGIYFNIMK